MEQLVDRSMPSQKAELERLASLYCWDMDPADATVRSDRVILRVMDLGTIDDLLALERAFDRGILVEVLSRASAGALTPRTWSFWHYRLGLAAPDEAVPAQPLRKAA
jgi:hypothetical protein